jgi:hypothetical protein
MSQRGRKGGSSSIRGRKTTYFSRPRRREHGSKQIDQLQDASDSDIDESDSSESSSAYEHEDDTFAGQVDFEEGK